MAVKRRRSRSTPGLGLVFAWSGAILALTALVFAGIGLAKLRTKQASLDSSTLCTGKETQGVTALLFDSSDPLNDLQKIKVRQILDSLLQQTSKGARVDVYMATAEAGQLADPLFSKCNPSDSKGSAGLSENPQRVLEMRRTQFDKPLEQALQRALQAQPRETSPILETVAAVSVLSFGKNSPANNADRGKNQLIIVSDFLQNSAILTQYKTFPDVEIFTTKPGWISSKSDLNNVSIVMIYINRRNSMKYQNKNHRKWWCSYFWRRGASTCTIEQL